MTINDELPLERETNSKLDRFTELFEKLFVLGLLVAGLLMALLFAAGFVTISRAIWLFSLELFGHESAGPRTHPLVESLRGLEYLFLAPLGYMIFLTLIRFLEGLVKIDDHPQKEKAAERQMMTMKTLMVNLLVAVVATDLVSKILGSGNLTLEVAIPELLVMTLFLGYLVLLHRHR